MQMKKYFCYRDLLSCLKQVSELPSIHLEVTLGLTMEEFRGLGGLGSFALDVAGFLQLPSVGFVRIVQVSDQEGATQNGRQELTFGGQAQTAIGILTSQMLKSVPS